MSRSQNSRISSAMRAAQYCVVNVEARGLQPAEAPQAHRSHHVKVGICYCSAGLRKHVPPQSTQ
eukprot:5842287-Amphidinium_carterae.1